MGKTYRSAATSGSRHAIGTSVDADLVTFVTAFVLYAVAIGPVRGFALTLMIGIAIDLFTAILLHSTAADPARRVSHSGRHRSSSALRRSGCKRPRPNPPGRGVSPMPKHRFDFMGHRKVFLRDLGGACHREPRGHRVHGLNFGIEFEGGTVIDISKTQNVSIESMRDAFGERGFADAEIQTVQGGAYIIRITETDPQKATALANDIAANLKIASGDVQVTTIGPNWGKNVTNRAMLALALSFLAILVYVTLRFTEWKMAIAAIIALVHDIIITLGIYALTGRELTPNHDRRAARDHRLLALRHDRGVPPHP